MRKTLAPPLLLLILAGAAGAGPVGPVHPQRGVWSLSLEYEDVTRDMTAGPGDDWSIDHGRRLYLTAGYGVTREGTVYVRMGRSEDELEDSADGRRNSRIAIPLDPHMGWGIGYHTTLRNALTGNWRLIGDIQYYSYAGSDGPVSGQGVSVDEVDVREMQGTIAVATGRRNFTPYAGVVLSDIRIRGLEPDWGTGRLGEESTLGAIVGLSSRPNFDWSWYLEGRFFGEPALGVGVTRYLR